MRKAPRDYFTNNTTTNNDIFHKNRCIVIISTCLKGVEAKFGTWKCQKYPIYTLRESESRRNAQFRLQRINTVTPRLWQRMGRSQTRNTRFSFTKRSITSIITNLETNSNRMRALAARRLCGLAGNRRSLDPRSNDQCAVYRRPSSHAIRRFWNDTKPFIRKHAILQTPPPPCRKSQNTRQRRSAREASVVAR